MPGSKPATTLYKLKSLETYGKRDELSCGTNNHHPKTVVVVAIVWIVVVAIRRAHVVCIVVPRAAAQDAPVTRFSRAQLPVLAAKYNKKQMFAENF